MIPPSEEGVLAVEMEAAALYAFATARGYAVLCVAHVTNQMARTEGDFEKGEANGAREALRLIEAIVDRWPRSCDRGASIGLAGLGSSGRLPSRWA